jgi:hypothetical protein
VLDGVFAPDATGTWRFTRVPPTDREVARLLATIVAPVERPLRRRGLTAPAPSPTRRASGCFIGPGLTCTWGATFAAEIAADLPVEHADVGRVPQYRIRGGLACRF